jgi:fatty-acyl-CoA synthase
MQTYSLTVDKFLDHAAKWCGDREIVEAEAGRVVRRTTYGALRERSNRLSGALASLGLEFGDRIGTLAWNTQHHLELYYAAMGAGLVCHTLNPRLTPLHLAAMINEAEDRVLAVSANLLPMLDVLAPLCPGLKHVIVMDGGSAAPGELGTHAAQIWDYEALLETRGAPSPWGEFDENSAAGLCYTSGTTGTPKGVLYTHRSNYLHTMRALQADAIGLAGSDVVLLAVPMFHANGWGLPFAAPAAGAKMVLPGRHTDGKSLATLMRDEGVTIAVGVQTVWMGVVDYLDSAGGDLPDLKRVLIGGSNCPEALIQHRGERLDAHVQTSWGMTELSPMGTIAPPDATPAETQASGRPPMGLDLKLTDADGVTLPEQRNAVGYLKVKGMSVLDRYFRADTDALDAEGYFDTGDLASIDDAGNLTICGRTKDLIKSGGEWINPTEIEAIVGCDPTIAAAAVIGRPDIKWGERPVLIVAPRQGQDVDARALLASLKGKVADWWIPDQIVQLPTMPLAATGKIDKIRLRADYASGRIEGKTVGR